MTMPELDDEHTYVEVDRDLVKAYREAVDAVKEKEVVADRLKAKVIEAAGDADRVTVDGDVVLTYTRTSTTRLDSKRLKAQWPQIWEEFSSTKPSASLRWAE